MTRDALYRAYDGLRPSDAARERMLQAVKEAAAHPETEEHPQRRTPAFRRTLMLAAALVLIVAFGSVAYATGWFGLRSAVMYHDNGDPDQPYGNTDVMSLQGLAGSPEFEANARWHAFYESYDPDGAILASVGNSDTGLEPRYDAYPCYTREMADTLDAIAEESGLELLSGLTLYGATELPDWMRNTLPHSCGAFDTASMPAIPSTAAPSRPRARSSSAMPSGPTRPTISSSATGRAICRCPIWPSAMRTTTPSGRMRPLPA